MVACTFRSVRTLPSRRVGNQRDMRCSRAWKWSFQASVTRISARRQFAPTAQIHDAGHWGRLARGCVSQYRTYTLSTNTTRSDGDGSIGRRIDAQHVKKKHDPLRILFCGADAFSIYSLRALHDLHSRQPSIIESIDVLCRPDKPVGRGLREIQSVPIKAVAQDLKLPIHQVDTFKDWILPTYINLIVAVSFGLLVPAQFLTAAKYGGLNVHPSLLPALRGAAPIQHALLRRLSHTGVSLQTMHASRFDHGDILDQTPAPGISISNGSTVESMIKILGQKGADMLSRGIQNGLFVPPAQAIKHVSKIKPSYATKITPADREINWHEMTADDIILRDRILGRLWDNFIYADCSGGPISKRITYMGPWKKLERQGSTDLIGKALRRGTRADPQIGFRTINGEIISPFAATMEGEKKGHGVARLWTMISESGLSKGTTKHG